MVRLPGRGVLDLMPESKDTVWMRQALDLARPGLGSVWPNPSVGCVVVQDSEIVGSGATGRGGRPHAEVSALRQAGKAAAGATVYVTLEPCSHWGRTPPCTDALVDAKVSAVVVAVSDPDPRVNGKGILRLREAAIEVVAGVCEEDARKLNAGFFTRVEKGRPRVVVVTASTEEDFESLCRFQDAVLVGSSGSLLSTGGSASMGQHVRPIAGDAVLPRRLAELGEEGLTRVAVASTDLLADRLRALGLVDEELGSDV
ncbi:MAG: bifunctional diaminohydroxyphosphoribosylaminopyrimidine deaminase/5-amino-6-(5-phosphoribosylamino)uracil reductase RibD [Myxococcota bacterium]